MGKKNKGTKNLRPSIQKEYQPAKQSEKRKSKPEPLAGETARVGFDKKDVVLCSLLILIFFFLGIWNIGSPNTPRSGWTPAQANESFYIDFKNEYPVNYVYLFQGNLPKIDYKIYSGSPNNWNLLYNLSKENFVLSWSSVPVNSTTRYLRFVAATSGGEIDEIVVYTGNRKIPISKDSIICESDNCATGNRSLSNLVDEQNNIEDPPSYLTGAIFDEIYFARTAYEHLMHLRPFEYTHPPLGKLLIATGILTFGLDAFGWRIIPLIFGVVMIPVMYIFGKSMFNTRFGGFSCAFLLAFESMHFVLSRIAMIDIILSAFTLLMFYFFYMYYRGEFFKQGWKNAYAPLLISGIFFGLAVSVKLTALFGALAVMVLFLLLKKDELTKAERLRKNFFIPFLLIPMFVMFMSFVVISFIIYALSYTPIMGIPGEGSGLSMVFRYSGNMLRYHETLTATHPFSSPWWSWIFMLKPVWLYNLNNPFDNTVSNIVAIGNPAIWWASIPFLIFVAWRWLKEKDSTARFITVAFLLQLLPYMFIGRILFLYHMFLNVPFMIFAIVYGLNILWYKNNKYKYIVVAYFAAVLLLFVYFYPILAAYPASQQFTDAHKWLSGWIF
jgi:predicted membrane-bound dolichyl-phosphate-mannose-protein mannosyltransferase